VVDSKSTFLKTSHNNAMIALKKFSEKVKTSPKQHQTATAKQKQDINEYNRLINMLKGNKHNTTQHNPTQHNTTQ
jgi:hypothetical protein